MRSLILVLLALIAGAAAGAGFAVAWLGGTGGREPKVLAVKSSERSTDQPGKVQAPPEAHAEQFQRLANALLTIDERLSAMEVRDEATAAKQKKLIDDVRELAIHLEVRSGELEPLNAKPAGMLEPIRPEASVLPLQGIRPVPSSVTPPRSTRAVGQRTPSAGENEGALPEW